MGNRSYFIAEVQRKTQLLGGGGLQSGWVMCMIEDAAPSRPFALIDNEVETRGK